MSPAADQSPGLVIEMSEFHLQPPLRGRGAFAEDFEDQPGAVDDLGLGDFLDRLLLHRAKCRIDDQQMHVGLFGEITNFLDLPLAEQARWPCRTDAETLAADHVDADGRRKPGGFVQTRLGRAHDLGVGTIGKHDQRAFAARYPVFVAPVEDAQLPSSVTSGADSSTGSSPDK